MSLARLELDGIYPINGGLDRPCDQLSARITSILLSSQFLQLRNIGAHISKR